MRHLGGPPGYIFSSFFIPGGPPKGLIDPPFTLPIPTYVGRLEQMLPPSPESDFF